MTSLEDAAHIIGEQREVIKDQAEMMERMAKSLLKLTESTGAVNSELWWCAIQLKFDWKDGKWRRDSSVGRAYDASVAARIKAQSALTAYEKAKHNG